MISTLLIILAGTCEGLMDALQFRYNKSIFFEFDAQFWNPKLSWKNKYKPDSLDPKFLGSTTVLVFLTDGWHLLKFFRNNFIFLAIVFYSPVIGYLADFILLHGIYNVCFEFAFRGFKING